MGYDLELIRVSVPAKTSFPVSGQQAEKLMSEAVPMDDPEAIRAALLEIDGCKPGPENTVDFLGGALKYARFKVLDKAIHVENNCSPKELLGIYNELRDTLPDLLIFDPQSRQLHDADSYTAWWSKPL